MLTYSMFKIKKKPQGKCYIEETSKNLVNKTAEIKNVEKMFKTLKNYISIKVLSKLTFIT